MNRLFRAIFFPAKQVLFNCSPLPWQLFQQRYLSRRADNPQCTTPLHLLPAEGPRRKRHRRLFQEMGVRLHTPQSHGRSSGRSARIEEPRRFAVLWAWVVASLEGRLQTLFQFSVLFFGQSWTWQHTPFSALICLWLFAAVVLAALWCFL